jgi:hypothetical protein
MAHRCTVASPGGAIATGAQQASRRAVLGRRAFIALTSLGIAGHGLAAPPLNPGRFKPFVDDNRLDLEIAHVLNVLDSYPAGSWSRDSAQLAFDSLRDRHLLGVAKATTAAFKLTPMLLSAFPSSVPKLSSAIADVTVGGVDALTVPVGTPGALSAFVVFQDSFVVGGTNPGEGRERFALRLVHELNHVRNREQNVFRENDRSPSPGLFVDFALATSMAPPSEGIASFADFVSELAAAHVSYRCVKEWHNRWRNEPIPRTVKPLALYSFGIEQLLVRRVTPYLARLKALGADPATGVIAFNRQVALWMRAMRSVLFVSSPALNAEVGTLFENAYLAAEATRFRPPMDAPDGGINAL